MILEMSNGTLSVVGSSFLTTVSLVGWAGSVLWSPISYEFPPLAGPVVCFVPRFESVVSPLVLFQGLPAHSKDTTRTVRPDFFKVDVYPDRFA